MTVLESISEVTLRVRCAVFDWRCYGPQELGMATRERDAAVQRKCASSKSELWPKTQVEVHIDTLCVPQGECGMDGCSSHPLGSRTDEEILEIDVDELSDVELNTTWAARGKELLAGCSNPLRPSPLALLDKIQDMKKLHTPQKKKRIITQMIVAPTGQLLPLTLIVAAILGGGGGLVQ
ncbi:hypothetical protein ACRRTK_009415 [Alexandromys fortis]